MPTTAPDRYRLFSRRPAVLALLWLLLLLPVQAAADLFTEVDSLQQFGRNATLDALLQHAIQRELISGAVLQVGNRHGALYTTAIGRAGFEPGAPSLAVDTVFDIASLTKVFATTPAIVRLMDQGALSLLDPLSKWFPEFRGSQVTVLHLLTHTSGLSDSLLDRAAPLESAIARAGARAGSAQPGTRFLYADINFILLGNLVRRISSMGLDQYCREAFYVPLGMVKTGFNPADAANTAATLGGRRGTLKGVVQDDNARLLGGVAGHAGLFSTADDLGRFTRMLLQGGQLDGQQILSGKAVSQMIAPYYFRGGKIVRGLGWDRESPYSSAKGTLFSEVSFGHTGYSGTSIWIDPEADLYVVLLTTRLNYHNRRGFNRLRSDVATLAAALFADHAQRYLVKVPKTLHP